MSKGEPKKLKGIVSISSEDFISKDNQNGKSTTNNNISQKITQNTPQPKTQSIKKIITISKHLLHHQNHYSFQIAFLSKY